MADGHAAADGTLSPLQTEAAELEYQCLLAERAHFDAGYWAFLRYKWLGGVAALLGALTTASALDTIRSVSASEARGVALTGLLALALAVVTAMLNFFDPRSLRDRHEAIARKLTALRAEVRLFRRNGGALRPDAEGVLKVMLGRHAEILADAPAVNDRRHNAAKRQLATNVHYLELRRLTGRRPPEPAKPG